MIFSAGPELSVIAQPRLIEAVRTQDVADFATALETLVPVVLRPAQEQQRTTGGANPRLGAVFDRPPVVQGPGPAPRGSQGSRGNCVIVSDNPELAAELAAAVGRFGMAVTDVGPWQPSDRSAVGKPGVLPAGFAAATGSLARAGREAGGIDAVIVALGPMSRQPVDRVPSWRQLLTDHAAATKYVLSHAAWLHAAAEQGTRNSWPVRVVHVADATGAGGRSAAQALAQMARSANDTPTGGLIDVFSLGVESAARADYGPVAQLAARMAGTDDGLALRGAEVFGAAAGSGCGATRARPPRSRSGGLRCRPGSVTPCGRRSRPACRPQRPRVHAQAP